MQDIDALQGDLSQFLKECSPSLVMQQRDSFKASCTELLGETKARSIAQLDTIEAVGAWVDEKSVVQKIIELVRGPLYVVTCM